MLSILNFYDCDREWCRQQKRIEEQDSKTKCKSLQNFKNNNGPRQDPCGVPHSTV